MPYGAILIPNDKQNKQKKDNTLLGQFNDIKNKMMSGLNDGGLNIENATTLFKNTANLLVENKDAITGKFAGVGLAQLLKDGKMTNKTAINYLKQGFPKALGESAVALGFQSVDQLITALQNENGVNVKNFISAFENAGTALKDFLTREKAKQDIDGYQVIEIDATIRDSRNYNAETPDRRVQSGQSYQEYIHNLPDTFSLECKLQNGKRYTSKDFESIILRVRANKTPIDVILGDDRKKTCVITSFTPVRENTDGLSYVLELKQIQVGGISMKNISQEYLTVDIVKMVEDYKDTKTSDVDFQGFKPALSDLTKNIMGW